MNLNLKRCCNIPKHKSNQKPFKKVISLYKKYEQIPIDWELKKISEIREEIFGGGTPSTDKEEYWDGKIPWFTIDEFSDLDGLFVEKSLRNITELGLEKSSAKLLPIGTVLFSGSASIGTCAINSKKVTTKQGFLNIVCKNNHNNMFLLNALKYHKNRLLQVAQGTTFLEIIKSHLEEIKFPYPNNPKEEDKIATILLNLDLLIQEQERIIRNTNLLKKGLQISLVEKGIKHTEFKIKNLGKRFINAKFPKDWSVYPFEKVLNVEENPIELDDLKKYSRVTVKRRHGGIVLRDKVQGKEILVKHQFKINSGDFLISKRQIIWNACGLIPKEFDGAVVSNEYTNLSGTKLLDIRYFDLFSQTKLFKQTIAVTTQGVDVEKYLFSEDEWLKLKMPVPDIDEQKKIVSIMSHIELNIHENQLYKNYLEKLKKGLMQQLLTGKIRVNV